MHKHLVIICDLSAEALTIVPKEQQPVSNLSEDLCYFTKLFQQEQYFAALVAEQQFVRQLSSSTHC